MNQSFNLSSLSTAFQNQWSDAIASAPNSVQTLCVPRLRRRHNVGQVVGLSWTQRRRSNVSLTGGIELWSSRGVIVAGARADARMYGIKRGHLLEAHFSQIIRATRVRQLRKRDGRFDICATLRVENPVLVARGAIGAKVEPF
jgi:hypothetical protein